jgi:membrane-bound metal-dependent hydrolase YbcI (DUF457 family)
MFVGHFAVGFASKRFAPRTSLGALVAAPLLLDLLWPIFLLAGWEQVRIAPGDTAFTPLAFDSYPISHSLLAATGWATAFAVFYWGRTRYRAGAVVLFLGVLSHWFLDALTHRPDMPLYPGGPVTGLGLWNSVGGTLVLESLMFAAGVGVYVAATRPRDRTGLYAFWGLVLFLALLYASNLAGPPPPSVRAIAVVSLAAWLFPAWAWWLDRHRVVRGG